MKDLRSKRQLTLVYPLDSESILIDTFDASIQILTIGEFNNLHFLRHPVVRA